MEEAALPPPHMLMIDRNFAVYERRHRRLVSGQAPAALADERPPQARAWQAYQNRMAGPPAWERAERYREMLHEGGYRSIRALAIALGEDHSRIARVLKVLDFPESALEVLRRHAADARIRAHFTEKRLCQMGKGENEAAILREIEGIIYAGT